MRGCEYSQDGHPSLLPHIRVVPYKGEGHWSKGVRMNLVLVILHLAVLATLVFAYGRE